MLITPNPEQIEYAKDYISKSPIGIRSDFNGDEYQQKCKEIDEAD